MAAATAGGGNAQRRWLFSTSQAPGTGKPAVLNELQAHGYYTHGAGQDGYADWINRATGTPDEFPATIRTPAFTPGTGRTSGCSAPNGSPP
jgi:hypothetical protein